MSFECCTVASARVSSRVKVAILELRNMESRTRGFARSSAGRVLALVALCCTRLGVNAAPSRLNAPSFGVECPVRCEDLFPKLENGVHEATVQIRGGETCWG